MGRFRRRVLLLVMLLIVMLGPFLSLTRFSMTTFTRSNGRADTGRVTSTSGPTSHHVSLPNIPHLMPGDSNLPEVLYACTQIVASVFGKITINLRTVDTSACRSTDVCQALSLLRKYFKTKFDIPQYLYQLKMLKQRRFALTKRPDTCKACFDYRFKTLIAPRRVCNESSTIELLLLITTIPTAVAERDAVRFSLAPYVSNNTGNVRYVFLIGGGWAGNDVTALKSESATFGDILQDDYKDSYYNLSYKVLSGFKWAVRNCPRAKFIARSADDVYLNMPRILHLLRGNQKALERKQLGFCSRKAGVDRSTYGRHYQTHKDWPHATFGQFCTGTTYIISASGLQDIVKEAPNVPWFNLEDHWVAEVMKKVKLGIHHVRGFNTQYYPNADVQRYIDWRKEKGICNFDPKWYTLHRVLPSDIKNIYQYCLQKDG